MRLFFHRLLNRHRVSHYTESFWFSRGVCHCGWEGDVAPDGSFY